MNTDHISRRSNLLYLLCMCRYRHISKICSAFQIIRNFVKIGMLFCTDAILLYSQQSCTKIFLSKNTGPQVFSTPTPPATSYQKEMQRLCISLLIAVCLWVTTDEWFRVDCRAKLISTGFGVKEVEADVNSDGPSLNLIYFELGNKSWRMRWTMMTVRDRNKANELVL